MSVFVDTATAAHPPPALPREAMVERMLRSDASSDGRFLTGVLTTGVYCLPSCRARKPKPENVVFFAAPEAAEAAGLRPCKRCRPDLFYRDQDPDRTRVETMVAELRADPAAVRNARDLARRSGVGSSKLNELFRRHYHTTPAEMLARERVACAGRRLLATRRPVTEIAFAVGFESLSAFHDNFRAATCMSPQAYRRLRSADAFVLDLPPWFDAGRALRYLGRDPRSLIERVDGRVFAFALGSEGGGVVVRVTLDGRTARCRLETEAAIAPEFGPKVHARVLRYLGLTVDPRPFERRVRRLPEELARLVDGRRGLTIPQTRDLEDGLIWVIAGQQVSLPVAFSLRRKLTERAGRRVLDGVWVPPRLARVAELEPADLLALGFSRRKSEYLLDIARGGVDVAGLAGKTATEIEATLLAVRGLGRWSVHYLMMRALSFLDCVPVGDVALARSLQRFFTLAERPDGDRVVRLMEPFAPFRSLATFHLWDRLGDPQ